MRNDVRIAYLIEPRFRGGTSGAVARELAVAAGIGRVSVHAVRSAMFRDDAVAPALADAMDDLGIALEWAQGPVAADIVILHNPSFLRFQAALDLRIVARELVVVTHENFLRPGGHEAFDVARCLRQIDVASLALRKTLAPVSPANRRTVVDWLAGAGADARWDICDWDWHNICDFEMRAPTAAPADRRGRHSRPGYEKFPPPDVMDACFPRHAAANVILGAEPVLREAAERPHWAVYPFGAMPVEAFFGMIDFHVYFTAPTWRESFGRVLAEAIAAGKVAISDPETASTFGGGVIGAAPGEVDALIAAMIADPRRYRDHVRAAQAALAAFSAASFGRRLAGLAASVSGKAAA